MGNINIEVDMTNSFIHGLWGIYSAKNRWWSRLSKCDQDIKLYGLNPYSPKTVVYIFGEDNFKRMTDLGFDCRLIDKRPHVWDMETEQYRHKMEIWKAGTQEFDAVTFLDFDCIPLKPIPNDFWDVMNKGEPIKTPIYMYHKKRVNRPPNDFRKVSSASFVYIRGKEHAEGMIKLWEETGKPWKEEYTLTLYIDKLSGGWKGVENYRKHDPIFYQMTVIYPDKDRKNLIFGHYNHRVISRLIGDGKNVKERIDKFGANL
jgi:hypothetical protein